MSIASKDIIAWFEGLQDRICLSIEKLDDKERFQQDVWQRPEGGGGRSRVITGAHVEKGGVMFSAVEGEMPTVIAKELGLPANDFLATGVSIVLHARNPHVPIIHMNVRYFETSNGDWWFGGGIDVTPHYINLEEARSFHQRLKTACDGLGSDIYHKHKVWADEYFYNTHRQETRGIGGIFFDRLNDSSGYTKQACWDYVRRVGETFIPAYQELFLNNYQKSFTEVEKQWQNIRRGRYVEFNLIYDRGTKFGLQTNGRIESILVSMPPDASWAYDHRPATGTPEDRTSQLLRKDIDWLHMGRL